MNCRNETFTELGCVTLLVDLKISSATQPELLKDLEIIYGSLTIESTIFTELSLPKLEEISAATVPALKVKNNDKLTLLKKPNLKNITANDSGMPVVHIYGNPVLTNLSTFIPSDRVAECGDNWYGWCYFLNESNAYALLLICSPRDPCYRHPRTLDYTQDIVIVVVAAVGGILAVVGLVFLVCWCRKRNRKERDPESDGENEKSQRKVAKIGGNSQKGSTERSGGVGRRRNISQPPDQSDLQE